MTEEELILGDVDNMNWSFSRINGFYNCPHEWFQHYINKMRSESGFFNEFGGFIHEILEKYAKGELEEFELVSYYSKNFDEKIKHFAPKMSNVDLRQSYFDSGIEYLLNVTLDFDKYEILGVEKEVHFKIGNEDAIGFIDLLLREKENGRIIIVDHKSANITFTKTGKITKKSKEHFESFKRQLYLYSKPIIEEYGKVDKLMWNLFRVNRWIDIPWNEEEYKEAYEWAKNSIQAIKEEIEFNPNPDFFYCVNMCGIRNSGCVYKDLGILWDNMRLACESKKSKKYEGVGSIGIKMCKKWRDDKMSFFNWAIKKGFSGSMEVARIDESKDFSPENCELIGF